MKPQTTARRRTHSDLTPRQQALLAATGKDPRHGWWAIELLERRDAVARWRGQASCTIREVIHAINGMPA
jgi:hypothetical protein